MLPARVIGGRGRRYRQREQERTREKRNGPLAGGMPEKKTETCFDEMERIRLPLVKTMPAMHSRE
jgi:hypothetical protein